MAIDPIKRILFWTDTTAQTISRSYIPDDLTLQGHPQVIYENAQRIEGLAFDWINE